MCALHHHCHNLGTNSVHLNVDGATREGFIVASWDDPVTIPIRLHDKNYVYLTAQGGYLLAEDVNGYSDNASW